MRTSERERGLAPFRKRHPERMATVNYARVPVGSLRGVPRDIDLAVLHPYVHGVLDELPDTDALRDSSRPFPGTPPARSSTWSDRFPAPPRFRGVRET
ncbi:hypothetical protein [Streptomyces violaceorubidus]|uniref:hypothetical protein n=1 Tax=Streptomyces violaceorubidus TaxID=284042 RepID=UPI0004BF72B7|nr:hypothetical protein [Streptomyces violaceorubidus]